MNAGMNMEQNLGKVCTYQTITTIYQIIVKGNEIQCLKQNV